MEPGLALIVGILIRYAFRWFKNWEVKGVYKLLILIGTCLFAGTGLGLATGAVTFANFSFDTITVIAGQIFASAQVVFHWLKDRGLKVPDIDVDIN